MGSSLLFVFIIIVIIEKTKAQRGAVTCSRSPGVLGKMGIEFRLPESQDRIMWHCFHYLRVVTVVAHCNYQNECFVLFCAVIELEKGKSYGNR